MTAAAQIALTPPQAIMLRFVAAAQRKGEVRAAKDPVLQALGRRDMIVARECEHGPRKCRWIATMAGRAWIIRDDAERGYRSTIPVAANGNGVAEPGSRWTRQQLAALTREGLQNTERCAVAVVSQLEAAHEEDWTLPPLRRRVTLPRLAITRDGRRAKVITLAGAVTWTEVARG